MVTEFRLCWGHLSRLPPRLAPEGAVLKGGVQEAAVPQG